MSDNVVILHPSRELSPSERLLQEILRISLSDDELAISDVSISWTDIYGGRRTRKVVTAP